MARGWTLHQASGEMFSDELIAEFVYVCAEYWRNGQNSLGSNQVNHISNAAAHDSKELTAFLAFLSLVWHHDFCYVNDVNAEEINRETRDDAYYPRLVDMIKWAYDLLDKELPDAFSEFFLQQNTQRIAQTLRYLEGVYQKLGVTSSGSDRYVGYPRAHAVYTTKEIEQLMDSFSQGAGADEHDPKICLLKEFYDAIGGVKDLHWDIADGEISLVGELYGNNVKYEYKTQTDGAVSIVSTDKTLKIHGSHISQLKINGKKIDVPELSFVGTAEKPFYIFYCKNGFNHLLKKGRNLAARKFIVYGEHNSLTLDGVECQSIYKSRNGFYKKYDFSGLIKSGGELKADDISIAQCGFLPGLVISGVQYSDYSLSGVAGIFQFETTEERTFQVYVVGKNEHCEITIRPENYNCRFPVEYGGIKKYFVFAVPDQTAPRFTNESFRKGKCYQKCGNLTLIRPIEEPAFAWQTGLNELRDFNKEPTESGNDEKLNLVLYVFVPDEQKAEIVLDGSSIRVVDKGLHRITIQNLLDESHAPWKNDISLSIRRNDEENEVNLLTVDWIPRSPCFVQEKDSIYLYPGNVPVLDKDDDCTILIAKDGPELSVEELRLADLTTETFRAQLCYRLPLPARPENGGGVRLFVRSECDLIGHYELFPVQDNFDFFKAKNELDVLCQKKSDKWKRDLFRPIAAKEISFSDRISHDLGEWLNLFLTDFETPAPECLDSLRSKHQKNIFISLPAIRKLETRRSRLPGLKDFLCFGDETGLYFRILDSLNDYELDDFHNPVKSSNSELLLLPGGKEAQYRRLKGRRVLTIPQRVGRYRGGFRNQYCPLFLSLLPGEQKLKDIFRKYIFDEDISFGISHDEKTQLANIWKAMKSRLCADKDNDFANLSRIFSIILEAYDGVSDGRKMIAIAAIYCRMYAWHTRYEKTFPSELESGKGIITSFVQRIWNSNANNENNEKILRLFASDILVTEFFFTWCNDPRYDAD